MNKYNVRCQTGQAYQALTVEQLKSLAAAGMISLQDEISPDGSDRWVVASKVKGLFPAEAAEATTPPQTTVSGHVPDDAVEISQPPMPPALEGDGVGDDNSDFEQEDEDDSDEPTGPSGVALKVIGYAFIGLGIADFCLYNLDIWDFYSGLNLAAWIAYFTVIIADFVGSALVAAGTKGVNLPAPAQWILFTVASILLLVILGTNLVSNKYTHLYTVRYGSLNICPERTLDELATATMKNPSWDSLIADDGYYYVSLTGKITQNRIRDLLAIHRGNPVNALIQFRVDGDEFIYYAMEINGEPQNDLVATELINLLCSQ
jgi:hypothetical protein